jgi:glutamyl-tRNA reductase
MHLLALGLNHNSAPIKVRERAAVAAEHLNDALRDIADSHAVSEATILSTCNRTEVYCRQEDADPEGVVRWLCDYHRLTARDVAPYLYQHPDESAVRHVFRVAAGLDSMVLGEPQILGQMKDAFSTAHKLGTTGKILNRLFQQTFTVAKRIRTDTAIGASAVSVAYAAVNLAKQIFTSLGDQTVLMIGAGETIELTARHLHNQGLRHLIVANRTVERARQVADSFSGEAISLAELPSRLHEADILIASTASTLPILGKGAVEQALRQRKHRPMFMVDLAVPRDIEEQVAELDDVYLYTVDDLREVVEENMESRRAAADEAEKIIDLQTAGFMRWLKSLDAVPTILDLRAQIEQITQAELERAQRRLRAGDDPEQVLQLLAHCISQKLSHAPSDQLHKADSDSELIEAARRLFKLDSDR